MAKRGTAAGRAARGGANHAATRRPSRRAARGAAIVLGPAGIRVNLEFVEDIGGAGVVLTAGAGNGIVAVGDGAAWAGASDVELPFP
jgi:hypothetical protein